MRRGLVTTEKMVRHILGTDSPTRDDDKLLVQAVWETFYNTKEIKKLKSAAGIVRMRAKIQNDDKDFLPLFVETVKRRKQCEEEWRNYMSKAKER